MNAALDNALSEGIIGLLETFEPHLDGGGIEIEERGVRTIVQNLRVMRKLALNMEKELAVHRLGEANRDAASVLEDEAGEQLDRLARDQSGVVITPDFGRKP